jgi:hypothetical protein
VLNTSLLVVEEVHLKEVAGEEEGTERVFL